MKHRACLLALLTAACGGGGPSGFAGAYQVTQIGEDPDGCGGLAQRAILPEEEFFELVDNDFAGHREVLQHECTAPGACDENPSGFYFEEGGKWVEEFASADGLAMPCYVSVTTATLGRIDDTNIEIHTVRRSGDLDVFPDGCPEDSDGFADWDAIAQHYDELPCVGETVVEAMRLAQ